MMKRYIDHINGNPINDQIENIAIISVPNITPMSENEKEEVLDQEPLLSDNIIKEDDGKEYNI